VAGPRTLAGILPAITGKALGRQGMAFGSLLAEWPSIVGPRLADRTLPFRIVFPRGQREQAVLHLRVTSSMAVDIQHFAPQLIERINSFFGYQAVARLKLIHAVRPNRSPRGPAPAGCRLRLGNGAGKTPAGNVRVAQESGLPVGVGNATAHR